MWKFIVLMLLATSANADNRWVYNYSNIPIAPIVQQPMQPIYVPQPQQYAPVQQYRAGGYTVIQSGGQMAICSTFNNITTCY